ncbi:MAG: SusD/RagB family nutrient-binding outer membrane lipoprotein, partial [Chitinophagaceae bacterium]
AQMVDLWGDIPFSQAGQLITKGGQIELGKYDKGKDVYDTILNDLQNISGYLATVNPDPYYAGLLQKYDFINHGNIMMWRRYCNSLLLRLAMRISYENEPEAKSIVQQILGNPSQYPLVDDNTENIEIVAIGPNLNSIINHHQNGIQGGMGGTLAPGYMLNNIMKPSGDPRIQVFFSQNKNGDYEGVPDDWTTETQNDSSASNHFSRYDSTTFIMNNEFPGIIFTAAEVDFFKAEAYQRWGGGDPAAAYNEGIEQSVAFWYEVNHLNINDVGFANYDPKTPPTDAQVATFLQNPIVAYTGTPDQLLDKIATEQWINYGLMQAYQGWAEIRRTGYPALSFTTDAGSLQSPLPPDRLLYPVDESTLNAQNYAAVKAEDNVNTKIFWDVK